MRDYAAKLNESPEMAAEAGKWRVPAHVRAETRRDCAAKLNETPEMAAEKGMDEMSATFHDIPNRCIVTRLRKEQRHERTPV